MQEFKPADETVIEYLERFQLFVEANVIEADKLVPTLLTIIDSVHYTLLRGLVSLLSKEPRHKQVHQQLSGESQTSRQSMQIRYIFSRTSERPPGMRHAKRKHSEGAAHYS